MIPPIASQFVAGETMAEAIDRARRLNEQNVGGLLNLLGEHYDTKTQVEADAAIYRQLLRDLAHTNVRARITVKPTQLGLDIDKTLFENTLGRLVETAEPDGFVWIDMEDHTTVDPTLEVYERLVRNHRDRVGICLQANLHRSRADLERIGELSGHVRLVKGAYNPPQSIAYPTTKQVNEAFGELLEYAFYNFDRGVAVATHDDEMIQRAIQLGAETGTGFEFQLLMGVREQRQYALSESYDVWQYIPFGRSWLSYFYRRVTERRQNVAFALRALLT